MIASWVFSKICHSDGSFLSCFFCLYDLRVVLKFTVCPRYSNRDIIRATVDVRQKYGSSYSCLAGMVYPFLLPCATGFSILSAVSSRAICVGPRPLMQRSNTSRTVFAASSSTIQWSLSSGSLMYPYGGLVQSGLPSCPFERNTARIFLLVSFAYHSLMMFRNGVKSLSD